MLNLFFKKKLTNEQDERILNELKGFSIRYEHDVFGIDTKISVYSIREQDSLKIIDKLKSLNFVFGHQIFHGNPMFHDEFVRMDEEEEILSHEEAERAQEAREMTKRENLSPPPLPSAANSQIVEHKPIVQRTNAGADSDHDSTRFPYSPPPPIPDVVSNQLEEIQKGQRELRQIVNDLITARNAVSAPPTPASTSSVAPKSRAPYVVDCPAKNELIANGIRCEMCKETVKEMDIGKMVCALREHVICHFNRECPQLKRFECAVCKTLFTTNFVDEFEMHLKKHGTPLPEVRKKCMKNLTTKTHLQIIANLCLKCFPDVFEKEPPRLDTIQMEKVSNYVQLAKWNLRSLLNLPQPTVAPVIWRPSLMTSRHLPSPEFRNSLSEPENRRVSGILKELEILSKLSVRFPEKLTATDWKTLLELKSRKTRMDHLEYRFRKEKMAAEDVRKRAEAKRKSAERGREPRADHQLLLRFQSPETEKWQRFRRVVDSFRMGGPPILAVDCQFLTRLSPRGRGLTALQLQYLAATNREHTEPFRLFFVNYDRRDSKIRDLEQDKLKMLEDPGVFCPIVSASGLTDTFGREKEVIYLSPDASEELETVDDDKIYVIGGIVDRVVEHGIPKNASLEAAESAGVSARRLPIDRFVEFKSGSRFLTLLAVADILRQVNIHGDWRKALETTIPVRNLRGPGEKNQLGREVHRRIHEFNRQVLRRIEKQLGHEKRS